MKDINLLPDDIRDSEPQERDSGSGNSTVKVATIVIAVLILAGITFLLPKLWIIAQNARLDSINKSIEGSAYNEVKSVKSEIQRADDSLKAKNEIITSIDKQSLSIGQILNIVNSSTPDGCTLERVDFSDNKLTLQGRVSDGGRAAELLSNMGRINSLTVSSTSVQSKEGAYLFTYTFTFGEKEEK